MVVCLVQCEFASYFAYFHLLSGFIFIFIDLVDDCICDARLLAYVQRECCTMTSDGFGIF